MIGKSAQNMFKNTYMANTTAVSGNFQVCGHQYSKLLNEKN